MSFRSSLLSGAAIAVLSLAGVAHAAAPDNRDVVISGGDVVRNSFGNCVYTRWMATGTECDARYAVAEQRRVIRTARSLKKEERTVYFDFDKSFIRPEERPKLDAMADILKADAEVRRASIVGFADRMGTHAYNDRLSQRRAKEVEGYLHERGYLNTAVAQTRWLGESVPVTQCAENLPRSEKIACLQPDRRVEVEIEFVPTGNPAPRL